MQVTLLRDSKSRFGFAIGVEAAGVVITKIAQTDALPLGGAFDERDKMSVGDIVLSVGSTPLVNERGLPIAGLTLERVRALIKGAQGDSLALTVQRPVAAPSTPLPTLAVAEPILTGQAVEWPRPLPSTAEDDDTVVLIRDAQGRFGLNVDQDERGIFIKQLAEGPACGDGRARLQLGVYLSSIARVGTQGLSREQARAIIKGVEGSCLELGLHRAPPPGAAEFARGGAPAHSQLSPRADAAPHGWTACADGGYLRESWNRPDPQDSGVPRSWHDTGQHGTARRDPFLAFAMAGTNVPPAPSGRTDLPPRVYARAPPC